VAQRLLEDPPVVKIVEQLANGGQVLFDGRLASLCTELFYVSSEGEWPQYARV
jgi:hypothetical protein